MLAMLYRAPHLQRVERDVVARIEAIRAQVRFVGPAPPARRLLPLFLSAPAAARTTDDPAFAGYRDALGYVLDLHDDPHFVYHESLLRSLHYMMLSHDAAQGAGRWRTAPIAVHGTGIWEVLYEPPPPEAVPGLMHELVARLNDPDDLPAVVRAAMAHLNVVQIHPFADGNGRMGRALQTLVMVRDGILDPEFASIEHAIARDHTGYRESLYALGTAWDPAADTRPFLRFCLTAHLQQAERALDHARRVSAVWEESAQEAARRGLPGRAAHAIAEAALAGHVDPAAYRRWAGIDARRARADLDLLARGGLLSRSRGAPGAAYRAGAVPRAIRRRVWVRYSPQRARDPFAS